MEIQSNLDVKNTQLVSLLLSSDLTWLWRTNADWKLSWIKGNEIPSGSPPIAQMIGTPIWSILPDKIQAPCQSDFLKFSADRLPIVDYTLDFNNNLKQSTFLKFNAVPLWDKANHFSGYLGLCKDETQQKHAETSLQTHRGFLSIVNDIRKTFYKRNEQETIQSFLDGIVRHYGFAMSWYGKLDSRTVRPTLHAGKVDRYIENLIIPINSEMPEDARCMMSLAILNRQPHGYIDLKNDPGFAKWREYALELGYGSNLAIPFIVDGELEGGIMIYANKPFVFHRILVDHLVTATLELATILKEQRSWKEQQVELKNAVTLQPFEVVFGSGSGGNCPVVR
jgi:hypothetical protein